MHVLKEVAPLNHGSLDNAYRISLYAVQNIDECNICGTKRMAKVNATRIFDENVYVVMEDVPTRQFSFAV